MFVEENSASISLQGMRDRSMRSGTKFAREIQLTDWSTAGNLSDRSSGVQIPRDICTRFGRYLYSTSCSWIIIVNYYSFKIFPRFGLVETTRIIHHHNQLLFTKFGKNLRHIQSMTSKWSPLQIIQPLTEKNVGTRL